MPWEYQRFPAFIRSTIADNPLLSTHPYAHIGPTLEERATSFFVSNYVIGVTGPNRGHLDALNTTYQFDDNLMSSIKAVGLAGFSNVENSAAVMKEARKEYANALRLTNIALKSPETAKRDSTLLSIMILSIYETVSGTSQKSLKAWEEHIRGAAALVKLRGKEQLRTAEGRRMMVQVTSNLLISCIQRELPLPDYILELREEIRKFVDEAEPAWRVQELMIQFCAFRATFRCGSVSDVRIHLARALELDGEFTTTFSNTPLSWRYETRYTTTDTDHVWNGCYHVYFDYWVAQIWNAMRTCRIMLNEAIRDALLQGFSMKPPIFNSIEHTAQFQISTDVLFQLQADILASVPQHVGFTPSTPAPPRTGFPQGITVMNPNDTPLVQLNTKDVPPVFATLDKISSNPRMESKPLPVLRASGGYFLMWPLFLAAIVDVATDESRAWAIGRLRHIGRNMGIRQAFVLAVVLETRAPVRAWMKHEKTAKDVRQGPYMEVEEIELDDEAFG
jgi:hypothetical protein